MQQQGAGSGFTATGGVPPLPAGAATSTKQDTGNTSLASIDTKLGTGAALGTVQANAGTNLNTSLLALESTQTSTNTKLDTVHTDLGLLATAAAQTSANTKLDTVHTDLGLLATASAQTSGNTKLDTVHTDLTSTNTKLDTVHTDLGLLATASAQTSGNTKLDTLHTDLGLVATKAQLPSALGTQVTASSVAVNIASDQVVPVVAPYKTGTDTFTGTGNGATIDVHTQPLKTFSLQVTQSGTVTSWDVRLEGSNDNTSFTQILQHTNTTGSGQTVYIGTLTAPCLYFRSRCAGLVIGLGTNITAVILGVI